VFRKGAVEKKEEKHSARGGGFSKIAHLKVSLRSRGSVSGGGVEWRERHLVILSQRKLLFKNEPSLTLPVFGKELCSYKKESYCYHLGIVVCTSSTKSLIKSLPFVSRTTHGSREDTLFTVKSLHTGESSPD